MSELESGERLHKFLARAGVASRRDCEQLILQGRVTVNGDVVSVMGLVVVPERDRVCFDGEPVRAENPVYYAVYKPKGVVCTTDDQFKRATVVGIIGDRRHRRLFPVGRLEEDSEGLILVTNDGAFATRILKSPRPLRQTYYVRVRGKLTSEALAKARAGVWLSDGRSGPMAVKILRPGARASTLLVTPSVQQHRLLRRVFAKVGVMVDRVVRVRIGPLSTQGLKERGFRRLSPDEVSSLLDPGPEDALERKIRRPRVSPGDSRPPRRGKAPERGGKPARRRVIK